MPTDLTPAALVEAMCTAYYTAQTMDGRAAMRAALAAILPAAGPGQLRRSAAMLDHTWYGHPDREAARNTAALLRALAGCCDE